MPVGALGELKPMLDYAAEQGEDTRLFLGLRDVLDRPEVVRAVWNEVGAYDYLKLYEAVLVYSTPDLNDAPSAYGLAKHARRVVSCNYVATEREEGSDEVADGDPLILVMGGGGADFFPIAKTFLKALPHLLAETRLRAVILPGPNMPADNLHELTTMAEPYPAEVIHGFDDATIWLGKASAVVTMAGYNSLCEVLAWQKKALVIPRSGPSAEQRIRSQMFADRQIIRVLEPESMTAQRMAHDLIRLLGDDHLPDPAGIPALDGARRAAEALLG
jgi:predicted glycosyltransferase